MPNPNSDSTGAAANPVVNYAWRIVLEIGDKDETLYVLTYDDYVRSPQPDFVIFDGYEAEPGDSEDSIVAQNILGQLVISKRKLVYYTRVEIDDEMRTEIEWVR